MNALYLKTYYERHPEKRAENRIKDAIRLLMKHGYKIVPPDTKDKGC